MTPRRTDPVEFDTGAAHEAVHAQARVTIATSRARIAASQRLLATEQMLLDELQQTRAQLDESRALIRRGEAALPRAVRDALVAAADAGADATEPMVFPFLEEGPVLDAFAIERAAEVLELLHLFEARHDPGPWSPRPMNREHAYGIVVISGLISSVRVRGEGGETDVWGPGDVIDPAVHLRPRDRVRAESPLRIGYVHEHAELLGLDRARLRPAHDEHLRRQRRCRVQLRRLRTIEDPVDRLLAGLRLLAVAPGDEGRAAAAPESLSPRLLGELLHLPAEEIVRLHAGVTRGADRPEIDGARTS